MRFITTTIIAFLLFGCAFPREISGSFVRLDTASPSTKTSPADVKIFLDKPQQKYQVVALVEASSTIHEYSNVADIEGALLSELRAQAALAGANGLVDIVRETLVGETVISTTEWGTITKSATPHLNPKIIQSRHDQLGSVSQGYLLIYRAKAIRQDAGETSG